MIYAGLASSHSAVYNCDTKNIFETVSTIKDIAPIIRIDSWVDLGNKTLTLPPNSTVEIIHGGLDNGCIVGTNTTLATGIYNIFGERLVIRGKWCVDHAYAEWFGSCGTSDDTQYIQKCLDTFFQCRLLNRTYQANTIKLPDNSLLEGSGQGRYQCSTLKQIDTYKGDFITTGDDAFSGVIVSGIRFCGGRSQNTAIRITVPCSKIRNVICDQYQGNGINLKDRAWGTTLSHCNIYGNMVTAKNRQSLTGILVDTKGGLISIEHSNINYYETGIHIKKGAQISINNCNISDCSQNEMKRPNACIKISDGYGIDIYDNYIENFSTGIQLLSGKLVNIHDNYINGLSVASFGVDIKGAVENLCITNNFIYMGYKKAWAISLRTPKCDKCQIHIYQNELDNNKLYELEEKNIAPK